MKRKSVLPRPSRWERLLAWICREAATPAPERLDRLDARIAGIITLIYFLVAFPYLGGTHVPQKGFTAQSGNTVEMTLEHPAVLNQIGFYLGIGDGSIKVEVAGEEGVFKEYGSLKKEDVFKWKFLLTDSHTPVSRMRLTFSDGSMTVFEAGVFEKDTGRVVPLRVTPDSLQHLPEAAALTDEPSAVTRGGTLTTDTYFDEIYHARTAYENIHHLPIYEWTHPPLGKLIIATGIMMFGMNPFGWRIMGMVTGALMLPVLYLLARRLFRNRFWAGFATFLFAVDFMHFVQTRISTVDVYGVFFILWMFYFMVRFLQAPPDAPFFKRRLMPLFLCGLTFGLGAASKWIAIYGGAGLALLYFIKLVADIRAHTLARREENPPDWTRGFILRNVFLAPACCLLFFVAIPVAIYMAANLPYLQVTGEHKTWKDVWDLQFQMYNYHANLKAEHPFAAKWYTWPLDIRPTWFYNASGLKAGFSGSIATFGNPAVWWTGTVALFLAPYLAWKRRDKTLVPVFVAFLSQYLPWVLVARLTWIYHFFAAVPFMILMLVYSLRALYEEERISARTLAVFGIVCAALFVLFYPVLSGIPVPTGWITALRWLPSWTF